MGWKNQATPEPPDSAGAIRKTCLAIIAGLVLLLLVGFIWNQIRLATDTDKLEALKDEPLMSYTPPGFERADTDEHDDHTVWHSDTSEVDDPRVYLHVTYRRPGASQQELDAAAESVTREAQRQGFNPPLVYEGYPLQKPVGKEWHSFTSLDGKTKGYSKIVADLKVEREGADGILVSLDYNGQVKETSRR